jgi:hypothetical protein
MQDIDFTPAYNAFAREYETILRFQAPEKTGELKKSIVVSWSLSSPDVPVFSFEDVSYGKFTDLGTLDYLTSEDNRGPWTPNPVREASKKGIAPRFWSSVSETDEMRLDIILESHKEKIIQEYFDAQR